MNALREEFEEINGYDVYAYYRGRGMRKPEIIGFCENYVEFLEKKIIPNEDKIKENLMWHIPTSQIGQFLKETNPTGKPKTIVIKLFDGRTYFAPKSEFKSFSLDTNF